MKNKIDILFFNRNLCLRQHTTKSLRFSLSRIAGYGKAMVISMIFDFGSLRVEIDVHKTREFYDLAPIITDGCLCDGCRNYISAIDRFPPLVKDFFSKTGINAKKATEIITWSSEDNGSALHYGGFYHLCGRMIKGNDCWKEDGGMDEDGLFPISKGYRVGFTNRISLPEDYLPAPAIQMEIDFHAVPWMLEKENTYIQG